jgi:hypothetical protein
MNIQVDLGGLDWKFGLMEKQAAFALSNSINRTLLVAQRSQQRHMARRFTIRRSGLLKASVRMLKFSNRATLTGTVGINPRLPFWSPHEKGGLLRPTGKYRAAPMEVRRSKRGSIPKGQRPRNLNRSFVLPSKGKKVIFTRRGKGKRSSIAPQYSLNRQVRIRPALSFQSNVEKTISGVWSKEINRAVGEELQRAKLR